MNSNLEIVQIVDEYNRACGQCARYQMPAQKCVFKSFETVVKETAIEKYTPDGVEIIDRIVADGLIDKFWKLSLSENVRC